MDISGLLFPTGMKKFSKHFHHRFERDISTNNNVSENGDNYFEPRSQKKYQQII